MADSETGPGLNGTVVVRHYGVIEAKEADTFEHEKQSPLGFKHPRIATNCVGFNDEARSITSLSVI